MQVAADKFCALANTTSTGSNGLVGGLPSQTTTLPPSSTLSMGGIGIGVAGMAGETHHLLCIGGLQHTKLLLRLPEISPTAAPVAAGESSAINTLSSVLAEASNVITSIW